MSDQKVLRMMAEEFFMKLYTQEHCIEVDRMRWAFPSLDARDKEVLNKEVEAEEIRHAVFQTGPDKAPGPDGFPPSFFQYFWHVVGPSIVTFV